MRSTTATAALTLAVGAAAIAAAAVLARPTGQAVTVWDVYDGDTFRVTLPDGNCCERIRIANIDAPERGARAGCDSERELAERARELAHRHLQRSPRLLRLPRAEQTDSWGRTLAHVSVDGRDLGALLIAAGVAVPWAGQQHEWCAP